jgi:hypothetical protein
MDSFSGEGAVVRDMLVEFAQCQLLRLLYHIPFEGKSIEDLLAIYHERCDLHNVAYKRSECVNLIAKLVGDMTLAAEAVMGTTLYRFTRDGPALQSIMDNLHSLPRDVAIIDLVIRHNGLKQFCHATTLTARDKQDLQRIKACLVRRVDDPCYAEERYQDRLRAFLGPSDAPVSTCLKARKRKHTAENSGAKRKCLQ